MKTCNKLLLNWKGPQTGNNYAVGVLQKVKDKYIFFYNIAVLLEAEREGFVPFIGLSRTDQTYESSKLFSVFERRLPGVERNSFKRFLNDHNLSDADDGHWHYLCMTQGRLATDTLAFLAPVVFEHNSLYLTCDVAGWTHTRKQNRSLTPNAELIVLTDEENEHDKYAVQLLDPSNNQTRVGYIPRPFNQLFYRLLKKNVEVKSSVVRIDPKEGRPAVIVIIMNMDKQLLENETDLQYLIDYRS